MKGMFLVQIVCIALPVTCLWAVDREVLLFKDGGHRVLVDDYHKDDTVTALKSKVVNPCTDDETTVCIDWKFVSANASDEAKYQPVIQSALNLWDNVAGANIRFQYKGFSTTATHTPYRLSKDSGGTITKIPEQDEFGNNIIEGPFIISMMGAPLDPNENPEFEFDAGIVSHTIKYAKPSTAKDIAETKWAGIYLNNQFQVGESCSFDTTLKTGTYNLKAVVAHEMGRVLGLAPSSNNASALFPICPMSTPGAQLSDDDIRSVSAIYPAKNFGANMGSLSGHVIKGEDGSPIVGAQLHLVSSDNILNLARKWIVSTVLSREGGAYKFDAIPAGNYILIGESLKNAGLLHTDLDDWLQVFGGDQDFPMEFYDGQGRESNHEATFAFSPQAAIYAATLIVTAGQANENADIITNVGDPNIPEIDAKGATHELLSQYTPSKPNTDLSSKNKAAADLESASNGIQIGGCEVGSQGSAGVFIFIALLSCGILIALRRQYRLKPAPKKRPLAPLPMTRAERLKRLQKFRIRFYRFSA